MSLHSTVQRLNEATREAVGALWDRYDAGDLTKAEFRSLATAQIGRDQLRASSIAVLALGAELSRQNRTVTATPETGLLDDPEGYAARELQAQEDTQAMEQDPRAAYGIAAAAAVMGAYQTASTRALKTEAEFFQRVAGPEACDLCIDLSDVALPVAYAESQYHHKGCQCTYQPVAGNEL